MIFNGFITDFAFSSRRTNQSGASETTVFAASNQGILYHQGIEYGKAKPEGEKMDDHELMMTEHVALDENYEAKKISCLSVHCTQTDSLLLSLSNGSVLIGTFDGQRLQGSKLEVQADSSYQGSQLKPLWQRYGECMVSFRDLSFDKKEAYVLGYSRKMN